MNSFKSSLSVGGTRLVLFISRSSCMFPVHVADDTQMTDINQNKNIVQIGHRSKVYSVK